MIIETTKLTLLKSKNVSNVITLTEIDTPSSTEVSLRHDSPTSFGCVSSAQNFMKQSAKLPTPYVSAKLDDHDDEFSSVKKDTFP